jgi:hypothetical protein
VQDKFNKLFVFLVSQLFLIFFYNISYAATTNICFKVSSNTAIAANGINNYSVPYSLYSNNNVLNLNVPPGKGIRYSTKVSVINDIKLV